MSTHDPDFAEKSAASLLDDLTPEEQAEWNATLERDPQARALHEELTAMNELLATHHAAATPASSFEQRMVSAFRRRGTREPLAARLTRWLRMPAVYIPAAAAALIALVWLGSMLTGESGTFLLAKGDASKIDRLLGEAEGFYQRGSYDLATKRGEQVLNIDKYNIAARRLMEKADLARGKYYADAYNQTRSHMLWQVSKGWEMPVRRGDGTSDHPGTSSLSVNSTSADFSKLKAYASTVGVQNGMPVVRNAAPGSYLAGNIALDGTRTINETVTRSIDFMSAPVVTAKSGVGSLSGTSASDFNISAVRTSIFAQNSKDPYTGKIFTLDQESTDGTKTPDANPAAQADARKLIRNAGVELEVRAFDPAAQSIVDLAGRDGGYIATRDSARLANGKMSGTLVVKIPPPALDRFLAQLASLGDIRNQSLGTEDVTKAYFDTDARLRNARRMEDGLLDLLKNSKGKVSDLLQVERELGRVREQIEGMQGDLKLWDSLAAYATVAIRLSEKDLDEAAAYTIREQATLSLASADVEKSFGQAKAIAAESNAQIAQSTLTQSPGQRAVAVLSLLLDATTADATIERLKALGRVLDFRREAQRVARDGGSDAPNARVERDHVQVTLTISSQDESPTQRTELLLETSSVEQQVAALREFAAAQKGEIEESTFRQDPDSGQAGLLRLSLPLAGYDTFLARIYKAGVVKNISVLRNDVAQPGRIAERAEVVINLANPPKLVASENGLTATLRQTFSQAVGSLMWSLRMVGVALAFLAPWLLGLALVFVIVRRVLRARKKRD